jgi:adenosine deaminase
LPYASADALRQAFRYRCLQDFLDVYFRCTNVLVEERDFYDLTSAYLTRAAAQNIRHAELFFDPQAHTERGIAFETVADGILSAMEDGEATHGITSELILCFLRDLDAERAMAILERALPYKDHIIGVGLDSAELGNPPAKFEAVFARARAEGFRAVAHAGEEGPASYIREAVERLAIERIDHGDSVLEDATLVTELAARQIPFTVCPVSNLSLGVVDNLSAHPLRAMLEAGLKVTVNSDDPAYFGAYLNDNFLAVMEALALSRNQIVEMARNGFEAAFLADGPKATLIAELDDYAR